MNKAEWLKQSHAPVDEIIHEDPSELSEHRSLKEIAAEAGKTVVDKLKQVSGLNALSRGMIHLSNALKDKGVKRDFRRLNTMNSSSLSDLSALYEKFGENEIEVFKRLQSNLGQGFAFKLAKTINSRNLYSRRYVNDAIRKYKK